MVLAIFLLMIYFLTVYACDTSVFLAISGASGVSISGLIWFAMRIARESSQMGLLIALAEQLSSEHALAAMQAIIQQQGAFPTRNSAQK